MRFHTIAGVTSGRLAICTRPRGGEWLETDLANAKREGWNVLVSALEISEEFELDLRCEYDVAQELGSIFLRLPIRDRGIPELRAMKELTGKVVALLTEGKSVAVHCRMGIGRSGLICASTLVALGADPDEAWARVQNARGLEVPDTPEQRQWLGSFAQAIR